MFAETVFSRMKTTALLILMLAALALTACNTVHSRIEEKSSLFNSLDPQTQERIKQGLIDVGFTKDMVYIALGRPDREHDRLKSDGHETTWVYKNYWQEYEGTRTVGMRRYVYYDPALRAYRVYYQPVRAEIYSAREEERTRVNFKDDRVVSIETVKD